MSGSLLIADTTNQSVNENNTKEIQQLQQEISRLKDSFSAEQERLKQSQDLQSEMQKFKDNFYDKTMQNVNLALQGANRATGLVSFFAILFTLLTALLAFLGIKEASSFRNIRLDAERNLRLTSQNLELASHFHLAYTYTQAFLYVDAIKEFSKVLEINNNNEVAHTQLGYLYSALLRPEHPKSKFHSKRAIELNPQNYIAYLNLGVAMNSTGEKKEDVLSVYLKGGEIAIANLADDITIGKFKLFAGHCYKDLNKKPEAKIKYDEARPYFLKYKDSPIKELSDTAKRWLSELEDSYKIVST